MPTSTTGIDPRGLFGTGTINRQSSELALPRIWSPNVHRVVESIQGIAGGEGVATQADPLFAIPTQETTGKDFQLEQ